MILIPWVIYFIFLNENINIIQYKISYYALRYLLRLGHVFALGHIKLHLAYMEKRVPASSLV